jgi:hypothetical protein
MNHHMMTRSKTRAAAAEDYDCLENNPCCAHCEIVLSEDDLGMCEDNNLSEPMCEDCYDTYYMTCQLCDTKHYHDNMTGMIYDDEEIDVCPTCDMKHTPHHMITRSKTRAAAAEAAAEAADLDFRISQARWDDLDEYTMMSVLIPNNEAWADLRLERQALNCYLSITGKPWPKIRDTAACIAWCRAP